MADFEVKENPSFSDTMRKLEITDEAHADLFNKQFESLLDNDNYLKKNEEAIRKELSGDAETKVSEHNASEEAHADIRGLLTGLTNRLNALADSDDTTLDQLSEIVAYIKNNKSLIDGITTSKVNVTDIIDNLTSNATNKPLSARQGKALNEWSQKIDDRFNDNAAFMAERLVTSEGENVNAGLNVGSLSRPVYFSNGLPVMCDEIITTRIFDSYEITRNPSLNKGSIPVAQNSSYIKLSSGILIVGVNLTLGNAHFEYNCMFPISFINSRYVAVLTENVGNKPEEVNHKNATITRTYNNYCVIKHDGGDTGSSYIGFDEYNEAFDYASVICIGRWK